MKWLHAQWTKDELSNYDRQTETGMDYIQTFAQHLQKEFMDKPVDKILDLVEQCMEVSVVIL